MKGQNVQGMVKLVQPSRDTKVEGFGSLENSVLAMMGSEY